MSRRVILALAAALALAAPLAARAAVTNYAQNFESMSLANPTALSDDGWIVYGNVYASDKTTYLYGYGPFPAPNPGGGFSADMPDLVAVQPRQETVDGEGLVGAELVDLSRTLVERGLSGLQVDFEDAEPSDRERRAQPLVALLDGRLGAHLLGHLEALDEDAGHLTRVVRHRFENEVEEDFLN